MTTLRRKLIDLPPAYADELGARTTDDVRGKPYDVACAIYSIAARLGDTMTVAAVSGDANDAMDTLHMERNVDHTTGPFLIYVGAHATWVACLWDGRVRQEITRRRRRQSVEITFDDDVLAWLEEEAARGRSTRSEIVQDAVRLQMKRGDTCRS